MIPFLIIAAGISVYGLTLFCLIFVGGRQDLDLINAARWEQGNREAARQQAESILAQHGKEQERHFDYLFKH